MFKPCGTMVLVKQMPVEKTSKGGIITSSADEAQRQQAGEDVGILVAEGPLAWQYDVYEDGKKKTIDAPQAKVGDVVIFVKYAGKQYTEKEIMDGQRRKGETFYHLMGFDDILGVMPEDMATEYKQQRGVKE